jgi:SnoaL-like protein
MSEEQGARAVWLKSKPVASRSTRPLAIRLASRFPRAGRALVASILALPNGRLRRSLIEYAMREAVIGSFNRRDFEEGRAFAAPDFAVWPAAHVATVLGIPHGDGEGLRGYDAFLRFLQEWVDIWGEFSLEPKHVVDFRTSILLLNHMRAHGPASGIEIDGQEEAQLFVFRSGRCVEYRQYWSWQEGLEAVGLRE